MRDVFYSCLRLCYENSKKPANGLNEIYNSNFTKEKAEVDKMINSMNKRQLKSFCKNIKNGPGQDLINYVLPIELGNKNIILFKEIFGIKDKDDFIRDLCLTIQ